LVPLEFWGQISAAVCEPNGICFITCLTWWRTHIQLPESCLLLQKREGRNAPNNVSSQISFCSTVLPFLFWPAGWAYQVQ
jgi:hypothetical protein